ncbi:uncharacterized protein KGF55_001187 [Candida pseudojiufengensis]|uniref:uncharacterized protein n=1 Tax=Candida pseudojiufengensis TaxID=497109 RepID=UPI0022256626|nr:uncharacterized protein KGF55_001187 [Candida pseudojiufengensis]KAI5965824.1 hypothetical protein KGF55_001187 [Candida pseudojiufengensis]
MDTDNATGDISKSKNNNSSNEILNNLARLLGIEGIDDTTLALCYKLLDEGVDPKILAEKIKDIQKETTI